MQELRLDHDLLQKLDSWDPEETGPELNRLGALEGGLLRRRQKHLSDLAPQRGLTLLGLQGNRLQHIRFKTFLKRQTTTTHLQMSSNSWTCDCELQRVFAQDPASSASVCEPLPGHHLPGSGPGCVGPPAVPGWDRVGARHHHHRDARCDWCSGPSKGTSGCEVMRSPRGQKHDVWHSWPAGLGLRGACCIRDCSQTHKSSPLTTWSDFSSRVQLSNFHVWYGNQKRKSTD